MTEKTVHVELTTVTPKQARQWLARNIENQRQLRQRKVDQYARDMVAGHWLMTGDTVKITTGSQLIDGQHRLAAVIQADIPVQMLVAYDVSPDVMPVVDAGVPRSFTDALATRGTRERMLLGSVVRRIWHWERGNYLAMGGGMDVPSNAELLERYDKDPAAFDTAAQRGADAARAHLGIGSAAGSAFFLFSAIDHERAHQFFDQYLSGANLGARNPILALRNRIVRLGIDDPHMRGREQLALFVRAWNAWREDRMLDRIIITGGGHRLSNENFPQPK